VCRGWAGSASLEHPSRLAVDSAHANARHRLHAGAVGRARDLMESTEPHHDRRSFLLRLGAAVLAAPALAGCGDVRPEVDARPGADGAQAAGSAEREIERPVLLPWGDDAVRIAAPPGELPVAYVSMRTRQLFVDREYRDIASFYLRAHISVSTGVWRIPLAGDSQREPVTPGDLLREFEELSIRDWDPRAPLAEDDMRLMRGRPGRAHIDWECVQLAGRPSWFRAGPWDIDRCVPADEGLCREDFFPVGRGLRFADHDCTQPVGTARFFTWACRPAINPADG